MIEAHAAAVSQPGVKLDSELRNRLHELARGDYSEAEFVGEISSLVRAAPDSAGNVLVAINQQFIRGEISADEFRARASKSRISWSIRASIERSQQRNALRSISTFRWCKPTTEHWTRTDTRKRRGPI